MVFPRTRAPGDQIFAIDMNDEQAALIALQNSIAGLQAQINALTPSSPTVAPYPGVVMLDSFTGTDNQRLQAAMDYCKTRPGGYTPAIMFPARTVTFTTSFTTYSGMKLVGPAIVGWQNPEISGGNLNPGKVVLNCGIDAASFLVGTATNYDGYVANLAFVSTNQATQFFHHPLANGTAYCWAFHNLSFQGFKHVVGNPTNTTAITAWKISGAWNVTTPLDTQFSWGGSDSDLFTDGCCNIGAGGQGVFLGAGKPLMFCSSLGKSNIYGMFFTCDDQWRAIRVTGTPSFGPGLYMSNMRIEGRNTNDPSEGALVRVQSGHCSLTRCSISYAMTNPTLYSDGPDRGVLHQTGGVFDVDHVTYDRATGVSQDVPFMFTSGGEGSIEHVRVGAKGGAWTDIPLVQKTPTVGAKFTNDASVRLLVAA